MVAVSGLTWTHPSLSWHSQIKMVLPTTESGGEGKTMYLTKSKVMQAGLNKDNLDSADPMACAAVATSRSN